MGKPNAAPFSQLVKPPCTYFCQEMETNNLKVSVYQLKCIQLYC